MDTHAVILNGISVPRDVVMRILSTLPIQDLLVCRLVCRQLDSIVHKTTTSLYKSLPENVFQPGGYLYRKSFRDSISFARSFRGLEEWTVCRSTFMEKPHRLARVLPNLKSIKCKFVNQQGSGSFSATLFELWPNLQRLQLNTWDLPPDVYRNLAEIVLTSHNLRESTIPTIHSPSLIRLTGGTTPSVQELLRGCLQLREVSLWSHSLDEALLSDTLRTLRVYDIVHINALQSVGVHEVQVSKWTECAHSPTARSLILENGTVDAVDLARNFPRLTKLTVKFLPEIFHSSTLRYLRLSGSRLHRLPKLCCMVSLRALDFDIHNGHYGRPVVPDVLIDGFQDMIKSCPNIRYLRLHNLQLTVTSVQQTSGWWRKYAKLGEKTNGIKVLVDSKLRGVMPEEFNQLAYEGKVDYFSGVSNTFL